LQTLDNPLPLGPEVGNKTLTVYYIIEYEDECNNGIEVVLPPLEVVITEGQTALHVLENAVHSVNDTQYRFTATYFSFGYHVHTINGTSDTFGEPIPSIPCYWSFLTKQPDSTDRVSAPVGVAHYIIPADNYTIIMQYTNRVYSPDPDPATTSKAYSPDQASPLASLLSVLSIVVSIMFG
jgi:hypothetical protein